VGFTRRRISFPLGKRPELVFLLYGAGGGERVPDAMGHEKYFTWIKQCRELLGKTSTESDGEEFVAMCNDISWFGCFDDGMTPEQAVAEYKQKVLN